MNFDQITHLTADLCHTVTDDFEHLFELKAAAKRFGVARKNVSQLLRASEQRMAFVENTEPKEVVTATGLFKIAFAGQTREAKAIRMWVASELVPLLTTSG